MSLLFDLYENFGFYVFVISVIGIYSLLNAAIRVTEAEHRRIFGEKEKEGEEDETSI